jgi:acetyltransferase
MSRHADKGQTMSQFRAFQPEEVALKDGERARLRLVRPDDAIRLQGLFYRLSPESIFYRALEFRNMLTDAEAAQLANVDGHQNAAIVAVQDNPDTHDEDIIAVARYGALPDQPGVAEAAIVVEDMKQRLGLGTLLIERLVRHALANGIRQFFAHIHYNNAGILSFIEHRGLPVQRRMVDGGVWEFTIDLPALDAGPRKRD